MSVIDREAPNLAELSSRFPGVKFSPSDEELISYYLKRKIEGLEYDVEVIPEIELCNHEPWDLPAKSLVQSDHEWFFFAPRGRKYPNGTQSKRATETGYWKATGKERDVRTGSKVIGTKRTLVFHRGRAPKGERTDWIMHEYCMNGNRQDAFVVCRLRKKKEHSVGAETSNQESLGQNGLVPDLLQMGVSGGSEAVECCSEKCGSNYSSTDVTDYASESIKKLADELWSPQPESEIQQKDCGTDDCFAEILKDDIIKLDESPSTSVFLEKHVHPSGPSQGTAVRRIRLTKQKRGHSNEEEPKTGNDRFAMEKLIHHVNHRLILVLLVMVALLLLFLLVLR